MSRYQAPSKSINSFNSDNFTSMTKDSLNMLTADTRYVKLTDTNVMISIGNPLQPLITTIGTLTSLTVNGGSLLRSGLTVQNGTINGTIGTPIQTSITAVGTLTSLNVSGSTTLNGVNVPTGLITGTLSTPSQPNITSVGTLTSLNVSGSTTLNGVNVPTGLISGTLSTPSQPNITSVGTLTSLTVSGSITGTLATAAQPSITSVGTLTSLNTSGYVGIGTASPSWPLQITGTAGFLNAGSAKSFITSAGITSGTTTRNFNASLYCSGGAVFNGEVDVLSDARSKTNIRGIEDAESIIKALNPIIFDYITDTTNNYGFIAQEVEQVLPDAVHQIENAIPNVYKLCKTKIINGELYINTVVNLTNKEIKLYDSTYYELRLRVDRMEGDDAVVTDWDNSRPIGETFVYGEYVNDFRILDRERIFAIGMKAIQTLILKVDRLNDLISRIVL